MRSGSGRLRVTNEQLLEWGKIENRRRQDDLAGVKSAADLQRAKDEAARRRRASGLSASDAARWVAEAQRSER